MKTNMYSIEIANIVKQFLTEDSWNFSFDEEHGIFKFGLRIKGKIHSLKYFISIRTNEIIVYGICPIGVDEEDNKMMMEMAEFLHRVNWGLRNGCFEFDFRDGEIRFRSYIDCDKTLPSIESIKNSISVPLPCLKNMALVLHRLFLLKVMHKKPLQCVRRNMRKNFTVYFLK